MLNTLVHIQSVDKGLQWAVCNARDVHGPLQELVDGQLVLNGVLNYQRGKIEFSVTTQDNNARKDTSLPKVANTHRPGVSPACSLFHFRSECICLASSERTIEKRKQA